jgi:hypothetical protein
MPSAFQSRAPLVHNVNAQVELMLCALASQTPSASLFAMVTHSARTNDFPKNVPSSEVGFLGMMPTLRSIVEQLGILGIAHDQQLVENGMNSMLAFQLRSMLSQQFCVTIPATFIYDHPSMSAIN